MGHLAQKLRANVSTETLDVLSNQATVTYPGNIMGIFRKKSVMHHLETTLAQLTLRAAQLADKRALADAALASAMAARQAHRLEGDLTDERLDAKLQADVDLCVSRLNGLDADISVLQAKISETEAQLAAERSAAERKAASEKLARDLDAVEKALPRFLEAARTFTSSLEELQHHFEATQMAAFVTDMTAQVEVAAAFALTELRGSVHQIADGSMPMPAPKPEPSPVIVAKPAPETRRLFALRPLRWTDADGRVQHGQQFEDCELTPIAAQRALRLGAVCGLDDPRRRDLKGARGGHHVNTTALDLLDLDAEQHTGVPYIGPNDELAMERSASRVDPVTGTQFIEYTGPARVGLAKAS